jgi:hypothetical protein
VNQIVVLGDHEGRVITHLTARASNEVLLPFDLSIPYGFQRRAWDGSEQEVETQGSVRRCHMALALPRAESGGLFVHWVAAVEATEAEPFGSFNLIVDGQPGAHFGAGCDPTPPRVVELLDWHKAEPTACGRFTVRHRGEGFLALPLCMWARGRGYSFRWVAVSVTAS